MINIFMSFYLASFFQYNVPSNDSISITPLNLKYRESKANCQIDTINDNLSRTAKKLSSAGKVYDYKGLDWFYEDMYLFNEFNKAYRTQIFDRVICKRRIYYCPEGFDPKVSWIEIKEWTFKDSKDAALAFHLIKEKEFVSDTYTFPSNWDCVLDKNILFFLCAGDSEVWEDTHQYIIDIVSNKFDILNK